mmetsp:Transcript_29999/g.62727  ORF Transcript_29999/g.62727 Transcript_29999/m.62727 type:complete len:85 (+) Transcript_29999:2852-3106(+)
MNAICTDAQTPWLLQKAPNHFTQRSFVYEKVIVLAYHNQWCRNNSFYCRLDSRCRAVSSLQLNQLDTTPTNGTKRRNLISNNLL